MTPELINSLEKKYFNFLINLFESKGTTFTKNLLSQYSIRDTWKDYAGDMSFISRGLEIVIQGLLFESVDWEICSTPEGADSIFQTSRAIIHIDAKAYKFTDGDATGNKITLGPNQTSCFTKSPLKLDGYLFTSNLPPTYDHKIFGKLPCLTYFLKLIYNLNEELETFRNFELILCSLPNAIVNNKFNNNNHFQAGRQKDHIKYTWKSIRLNYDNLPIDENNPLFWKRFHKLDMI